ncbi:MAG TPA: DUF262 domain-containing protein, partial [Thermoanaerobaculia bacterium]|nr:DUF262 domain-containing protein [Thermoanaerobaculia bacterium]
ALLLDSISKGFPIGAFLFWKGPAEAGRVSVGSFTVDAQARPDALWVVDGQQRITTLVDALLKDPELSRRLREYRVPAYIVEAIDEGVASQIFHRINFGGKPLQVGDFLEALHGARASRGGASLAEVVSDLKSLGFGEIDDALVVKTLVALGLTEDPSGLAATASALRQAIIFVKTAAQIPHVNLLPHQQPLVLLALFFHHHRDPNPRTRRLLARWFWRALIRGVESVDDTAIVPGDEERSVQNLLAGIGARPPEADLSTRPQLAALAALGAGPPESVEAPDVTEFLDAKAEWDAADRDRPSLSALVVEDE